MLLLFLILNNYYVKDIKEYEKKSDVAIYCSSLEKWNAIKALRPDLQTTKEYGFIREDGKPTDCIHINGKGTASKNSYEQGNYTIYPASDFLEDDILEKCKKKYPIGTKYKCAFYNDNEEVKTDFKTYDKGTTIADDSGGYVCYKGKFAEIIEEPKFEVGKWYKYSDKNNYYFKPAVSGVIGKNIKTLEEINGDFYKNTTNTWSSTNETKLADLSEIQNILPEGHVDKIKSNTFPEYVEYIHPIDTSWKLGKIYKVNRDGTVDFESGGNPCDKHYTIDTRMFKPSTKEAYEAQFVKELEKQWIPQAGDWAYRLYEGNSSNKVTKGKVYLVLEGSSAKVLKIIDDSGNKDNFDTYRFRKALPNEIPIEQQSIKQYPLTKEECFIDLKNTKIWIGDNPELSRKVQEKAFKLGSKWINGDTKVDCLDEYFLLFDEKGNMSRTGCLDKIYFNICKEKKEIFPSDLGINETTNYHKVDIFLSNTDPIDFLSKKEEFPTANRIIYSEKKQIKLTELEIPKQSYVKCISTKSTEFTLNKIYKIEGCSIRTNTGYLCMDNIRNNLSNYYSCSFEYSNEQEYLIQQGKQVHEKVVFNIQVGKSYPIIDELPNTIGIINYFGDINFYEDLVSTGNKVIKKETLTELELPTPIKVIKREESYY